MRLQWPLCLELLQRGAVDVMPMITHRFGFSATGVADGFDCAARSAETKAVKVGPWSRCGALAPECARAAAAQWLTMGHPSHQVASATCNVLELGHSSGAAGCVIACSNAVQMSRRSCSTSTDGFPEEGARSHGSARVMLPP